ncbi:MAG: hypothetical protein ACYC69_02395 [Thermodesulfovibrionales bacterium]
MSAKNRSLPKPHTKAFGHKKNHESEPLPLMADQMALAAAEGRLEQFMKDELPDNEHARKLASMMMGMTGMMPSGGIPGMPGQPETPAATSSLPETDPVTAPADPPDDIIKAVNTADVSELKELLKREHARRSPGTPAADGPVPPSTEERMSPAEKEVIDAMLRIAAENNLTPDWIMARALKVYIEEYKKTGRL